jgi:hypothetical protein
MTWNNCMAPKVEGRKAKGSPPCPKCGENLDVCMNSGEVIGWRCLHCKLAVPIIRKVQPGWRREE